MDAERLRVADGGLFIRDNATVQAGPTAELPETADTVIDGRGMIILPGLVNTHHHLYQTLTRAVPGGQECAFVRLAQDALPDLGAVRGPGGNVR